MHKDLLFEIGCEELPASVIRPALHFIEQYAHKKFAELQLNYSKISVEGTPRRLVLMVRGLSPQQPDATFEVTGPKAEIAFLENGELSKAGLGFVQAKNLSASDAYRKSTPKGEVIAAQVTEKGRQTKEILPQILQDMMAAIPFPKKMFWDDSGVTFSRPVRWLCCLYDDQVVPVQFGKVVASNLSCGHRFLAPAFIAQTDIDSYLKFLAAHFVELSFTERRWHLIEQSTKLAASVGAKLLVDEALFDTVANLVEYPWCVIGNFEEKFLKVPMQVLVSEMREHQKVFAVVDQESKLLPFFIVAAGSKPADPRFVAAGHARVLRARFEDGAFYFDQDCKIRLEQRVPELAKVMFQHKLGSIAQKSERLNKLVAILCALLSKNEQIQAQACRAAYLCKADLVSGVVGEFPELQGVMGSIYASRDNEKAVVAQAIEEHYWPKGAQAKLPVSQEGALLAIADKLDTLAGIIAIGKIPTASADPFALRRVAIGLVRIIVDQSYSFSLKNVVLKSFSLFELSFDKNGEEIADEVVAFVKQRLRGLLIESVEDEQASLLADAVLTDDNDNILDIWARFSALVQMKNKNVETFEQLGATFKRVGNILKKARATGEQFADARLTLLVEEAELSLAREINAQNRKQIASGASLDVLVTHYCESLTVVAQLKPKVDAFFEAAMVMCEDLELRKARMALLAQVEGAVLEVADFTRL